MNFWKNLGFSADLYSTPPLKGNAEGSELLVGREEEVARIHTRWSAVRTHLAVEGEIGSGKTSLVSVAAYRAHLNYVSGSADLQILPLNESFQLTSSDPGEFERHVYNVIARSIIDNEDAFVSAGRKMEKIDAVRDWLSKPFVSGGGVNILGVGGEYSKSANSGYDLSSLRSTVRGWLSSIFPSDDGFFVGVIDNLELLQTSKEARRDIEAMRDTLLSLPGIRWVLCGANGIIKSSVGSQRLSGVISKPIEVKPLSDESIPLVVEKRVEQYRLSEDSIPPVSPEGFIHLYRIAGRNLRMALKLASDFSVWLVEEGYSSHGEGERREDLESWLAREAEEYSESAKSVKSRGWEVFDAIIERGGSCSPGDFEEFGFNSNPAMRPFIKQLEDANLVQSAIDEDDKRRRTIVITSNGWLVNYKRADFAF